MVLSGLPAAVLLRVAPQQADQFLRSRHAELQCCRLRLVAVDKGPLHRRQLKRLFANSIDVVFFISQFHSSKCLGGQTLNEVLRIDRWGPTNLWSSVILKWDT